MNPHVYLESRKSAVAAPLPPAISADERKGGGKASVDSYVILRLPAVLKARGRSRSTHYLDIQQGLFPQPVPIGARAVGWPEHEVVALNSARIAGKNDAEIRALVARLNAAREVVS